MTFGEKIQKLRKEAGLSQEELSYQLGVSRQAISKWERDNGYPETEKIVRMSKIFNVTLDYLLNEEGYTDTGTCCGTRNICKPGNGRWFSFVSKAEIS